MRFFFHILLRWKENNPKTQQFVFFKLEIKHEDSKTKFSFSSIELLKVVESISYLNFKLMNMA
jgi:hypothetical protein